MRCNQQKGNLTVDEFRGRIAVREQCTWDENRARKSLVTAMLALQGEPISLKIASIIQEFDTCPNFTVRQGSH
jgi:hypothetical protein